MEEKPDNNFDKKYLLEVTNELYRVTLLFPKKEPLRYRMRELANDVLANSVLIPEEKEGKIKLTIVRSVNKALEILDSFFDIARSQNWVSPGEMLNLQRNYSKIRQELVRFKKEEKGEELTEKTEEFSEAVLVESEEDDEEDDDSDEKKPVSERQERILKVLREKGKMQVWEIKNIFSEVSKRTLRRDFKNLLKNGLVERLGERNDTFYQVSDRTERIDIGQA